MLAVSGGRLAVLSTPFGKRGFFWDEYQDRAAWDYYEVPATQCPRIAPEFLAEERRKMGDLWFRSEYLCQFVDSISSAFTYEQVAGAFTSDVAPLFAPADASTRPLTSTIRPLFAQPTARQPMQPIREGGSLL